MSTSGRTVARNASLLMAAQLITWGLTLALTVVLPRTLGAQGLGRLQLATAIWGLLGVFITFGMDTLLTKTVARDPAQAAPLFIASVLTRLVLFVPTLGAAVAWGALVSAPEETFIILLIIGGSALAWQLAGACQAVLQGLERMAPVSISMIVGKAVNTILCVIVLLLGQGAIAVAIIGVLAAVIALTLQARAVLQQIPLAAWPKLDSVRPMLMSGLPYLMSSAFLIGYQQIDVIMISMLVDERTIGWYAAASQLFGTLLFIPTVLITAVFPMLARTHQQSADTLGHVVSRTFNLLLLLAVPIGLGLVVVGQPLVLLLFGPGFAQSGPILMLFGVVLILTYQNTLLGQVFISADRQNIWTAIMVVATIATLPLDLLLVPWCSTAFGNGGVGGTLSFIVTELGMLIAGIMLLPRGTLSLASASTALRIIVAGLVMAAAVWPTREMPLVVPAALGAAIYAGLAILLRAVSGADQALLAQLARGLITRIRSKIPHAVRPTGA